MDAETGFLIDGKVYEVPTLDSLTMSERRVMFELSGLTQEDFAREEDEADADWDERVSKLMRHPGFTESLMHIAYQRGNPGLKRGKVQLVIDSTNYNDAVDALAGPPDEEPDEVPLASTTEPEQPSPTGSVDSETLTPPSSANGGTSSTTGSDEPDATPVATTTTRLGTSLASARQSSAA